MYPDLLGVFGVQLYGLVFERVLWILGAALMIWGVVNSIQIWRQGHKSEGIIQGIIVLGLLGWFGYNLVHSFMPSYKLFIEKPLILHSYAFMILVGICLGTLSAMKIAPKYGYKSSDIGKACLWMVFIGFIGARAAHVIVEASSYWNACFNPAAEGLSERHCLRWLDVSEGGLTFYGGVIAGFFVLAGFYIKHRKENANVITLANVLAPALAIAHGCGRIGCFAAGCCWGAVTTGSLGVHYPSDSFAFAELAGDPRYADALSAGHTPLMHATQLYEAFGEFALYGLLWAVFLKKGKHAQLFGIWAIGYGLLRFIVEIMRDDSERGHFFETTLPSINKLFDVAPDHVTLLSTSQGIAIFMILIGIASWIIGRRITSP